MNTFEKRFMEADTDNVAQNIAQVIDQLRAFDVAFKAVDGGTHVHKPVGSRIQNLLHDAQETTLAFRTRANLTEGDLKNIFNGSFSPAYLTKLIDGLGQVQKNVTQRRDGIAVAWVSVQSEEARKLVERTRKALAQLLTAVLESNAVGGQGSVIKEAERTQLVALLRALLAELEGPFVDRGRVKSSGRWFKRIRDRIIVHAGADLVTGGLSSTVVPALEPAIKSLGGLWDWLRDRPSSDVPDDPQDDGSLVT